jgi:hypothetical protein
VIGHGATSVIHKGKPSSLIIVLVLSVCLSAGACRAFADTDKPEETVPIFVPVDIRPGLCPNHLRIESPLTIPIAITATLDFEIQRIDPTSVRLTREGYPGELEPVRWAYADVGTPIVGGLCACHKLRGDGIDDLEFHFLIDDVVETFGLAGSPGKTVELNLVGNLVSGEEISGTDCAVVLSGLFENENTGEEIYLLTCESDPSPPGEFRFAYHTAVSDRVRFVIYDLKGRVVAVLNDMDMAPGIYTATWNGTDADSTEVPSGTYFARINNSFASDIRKIAVP